MTDVAATPPRPFFEVTGLKFRLWPILLAAVLMQAMLVPAREAARFLFKHYPAAFGHQVWAFVTAAEVLQIAVGLLAVLVLRRLLPQAETNLRWPPGKTYVRTAVLVGLGMALVMLVADYWPQLLSHTAPKGGYELTPVGVPGWLGAEFLAGPNEELVFRGVLVGMLGVLVAGRVRVGRLDLPVAGVIMGLLFGAAHYKSFLIDPLHEAIAQQLYAFVWGLTYVWLMERSRSLLAPAIAHGLGDLVEVAAVMALTAAWS